MDKRPMPQVGVCLCVRKGDKMLVHKRKGKHAPGSWAFAGGHLEFYETFEECAIREMREECGPLEVTWPVFWTAINTRFLEEGKHYVVVVMVCDWISGEPQVMEPKKCECWEWRSWNDLPAPLMQGLQWIKDRDMNPMEFKIKE